MEPYSETRKFHALTSHFHLYLKFMPIKLREYACYFKLVKKEKHFRKTNNNGVFDLLKA